MKIFESNYTWGKPLRSIGVRGTDLVSAIGNKQLSFLDDDVKEERQIRLESTIDDIRRRFGHFSVQRLCRFLLVANTLWYMVYRNADWFSY
jgi:DNA polymerase-4